MASTTLRSSLQHQAQRSSETQQCRLCQGLLCHVFLQLPEVSACNVAGIQLEPDVAGVKPGAGRGSATAMFDLCQMQTKPCTRLNGLFSRVITIGPSAAIRTTEFLFPSEIVRSRHIWLSVAGSTHAPSGSSWGRQDHAAEGPVRQDAARQKPQGDRHRPYLE